MSLSRMFTAEQKAVLKTRRDGGVVTRFEGEWYMQRRSDKVFDFGGKKKGGEAFIDTALRELTEESGLVAGDIARVYDVFAGPYYGVILVEVNKEPIAVEPGSTIVRMGNYSSAEVSGRLYITGLQRAMRAVEDAENMNEAPIAQNNYGFIFDDDNN
jgi:hypothetical protein